VARMQRTQVYLEPELADSLDRLARERGTSRADLIRTAARDLIARETSEYGSILKLAGIGVDKDGATDVSVRHDAYLAELVLEKWHK
jgi:ribbon-helix-helix CopG family protein